jgi:hypothetical protein
MIITHKAVLFLLVMIFFLPLFCGQAQERSAAPPRYVELVVGPFDAFTRSSGLDDDKVYRAAATVLASQGFAINEKSDVVLSVTVSSRSQSDEEFYPFRVEVHAGTRPVLMEGEQDASTAIGDIPGMRNVSATMNSDTEILAAVRDVVGTVASKLRAQMDLMSRRK